MKLCLLALSHNWSTAPYKDTDSVLRPKTAVFVWRRATSACRALVPVQNGDGYLLALPIDRPVQLDWCGLGSAREAIYLRPDICSRQNCNACNQLSSRNWIDALESTNRACLMRCVAKINSRKQTSNDAVWGKSRNWGALLNVCPFTCESVIDGWRLSLHLFLTSHASNSSVSTCPLAPISIRMISVVTSTSTHD